MGLLEKLFWWDWIEILAIIWLSEDGLLFVDTLSSIGYHENIYVFKNRRRPIGLEHAWG